METGATFDRTVDALGHRYRRQLLMALLEHNPQDDEDMQGAEDALGNLTGVSSEEPDIKIELIHSHLPKLEEHEYITWDRESGEISKGPNWSEIAPLLHLLDEHADELPDGWL